MEYSKPNEAKAKDNKPESAELDVKLDEVEINAVNEAIKKEMNVFQIHVHVDENCILKAARAFLVFKAMEEMGEIIKSVPSAQDIEDEKFDFDFSVIFVTVEAEEKVKAAVSNVSEIILSEII